MNEWYLLSFSELINISIFPRWLEIAYKYVYERKWNVWLRKDSCQLVSGVSRQQGWQRIVELLTVAALVAWSAGGCGYGGGAWGWRSSAIRGAPPQHNRPCSKSGRSVHSDSSISLNLISLSLSLSRDSTSLSLLD